MNDVSGYLHLVFTGEEGLLTTALNDKDKITKATVTEQLKQTTDIEEVKVLKKAQQLITKEAAAKKELKDAELSLNKKNT